MLAGGKSDGEGSGGGGGEVKQERKSWCGGEGGGERRGRK